LYICSVFDVSKCKKNGSNNKSRHYFVDFIENLCLNDLKHVKDIASLIIPVIFYQHAMKKNGILSFCYLKRVKLTLSFTLRPLISEELYLALYFPGFCIA